jgi:hypothetical protein
MKRYGLPDGVLGCGGGRAHRVSATTKRRERMHGRYLRNFESSNESGSLWLRTANPRDRENPARPSPNSS